MSSFPSHTPIGNGVCGILDQHIVKKEILHNIYNYEWLILAIEWTKTWHNKFLQYYHFIIKNIQQVISFHITPLSVDSSIQATSYYYSLMKCSLLSPFLISIYCLLRATTKIIVWLMYLLFVTILLIVFGSLMAHRYELDTQFNSLNYRGTGWNW